MGEGLGGGEAAQLLSDRLMDAIDICQDFVVPKPQDPISLILQEPTSLGLPGRRAARAGRRRFPRSIGPHGTRSRRCSGHWDLGGGICTPSFGARAVCARLAFLPRSCPAAQTASSRACAVDGMLLHASTGAAGSITPSQLSPDQGEDSFRPDQITPTPERGTGGASARCRPGPGSHEHPHIGRNGRMPCDREAGIGPVR